MQRALGLGFGVGVGVQSSRGVAGLGGLGFQVLGLGSFKV